MGATISIAMIVEDTKYLLETYKTSSIIADEYVFLITRNTTDKIKNLLFNIQGGDDRIKILSYEDNDRNKQLKYLLKYCYKDYIVLLNEDELLNDNCVLIKKTLNDFPETEAFNLVTNYYIYHLGCCDNTPLQNLPLIRVLRNKADLLMINEQPYGLVEPVLSVQDVIVHNYSMLDINNITSHFKFININEANNFIKNLVVGAYPIRNIDIRLHPQVIKDKFGLGILV